MAAPPNLIGVLGVDLLRKEVLSHLDLESLHLTRVAREIRQYADVEIDDRHKSMRDYEDEMRPKRYIHKQKGINSRMREILIDWLVDVQQSVRLTNETLHLATCIVDLYCSTSPVCRTNLQLVGVTALNMACKLADEEPDKDKCHAEVCSYLTDRAYTADQVREFRSEMLIKFELEGLHYARGDNAEQRARSLRIGRALMPSYGHLQKFTRKLPTLTRTVASYYLERTLQHHEMLRYRPSLIAAASVILALNNPSVRRSAKQEAFRSNQLMPRGFPDVILRSFGFSRDEVLMCATDISSLFASVPFRDSSGRDLDAVKRKYGKDVHQKVSITFRAPKVGDIQEQVCTLNCFESLRSRKRRKVKHGSA